MLFVVEIKDNRDRFLLNRLIMDGYSAIESGKERLYAGDKVYIMSLRTVLDIKSTEAFDNESRLFSRDISTEVAAALKAKNIRYYDYNNDEVFLLKNAYLTAEGALAHIIMNTDPSLTNTYALILGYGRVGRAIAEVLKHNGAKVAVAARRKASRDEAIKLCTRVYTMENFIDDITDFTTIINTIPDKIIKGEILDRIDKDCFILDLASLPGGVDFDAAKNKGLNVLHALGIPGKAAPKTAAAYLEECILAGLDNKK